MKKSAHQIWIEANAQNLNAEQRKELYKKEGIIVPKNLHDYEAGLKESN